MSDLKTPNFDAAWLVWESPDPVVVMRHLREWAKQSADSFYEDDFQSPQGTRMMDLADAFEKTAEAFELAFPFGRTPVLDTSEWPRGKK